MYKGVTTSELDELAAETAASMTATHPDYALVRVGRGAEEQQIGRALGRVAVQRERVGGSANSSQPKMRSSLASRLLVCRAPTSMFCSWRLALRCPTCTKTR